MVGDEIRQPHLLELSHALRCTRARDCNRRAVHRIPVRRPPVGEREANENAIPSIASVGRTAALGQERRGRLSAVRQPSAFWREIDIAVETYRHALLILSQRRRRLLPTSICPWVSPQTANKCLGSTDWLERACINNDVASALLD